MDKILNKYNSYNEIIFLDVNCKKVKPTKSCILIKIRNVYLYTDSETFTGVFEFTKRLNINGKKIWEEETNEKGLGLFKLGDTQNKSFLDRFNTLSEVEKNKFEVNSMYGFSKTFGWMKPIHLGNSEFEFVTLELRKLTGDNYYHINFKYNCIKCNSTGKNKFVDSRFDFGNGILFQKCEYIFGDKTFNPMSQYNINSTCLDCIKSEKNEILGKCKCGKFTYTHLEKKIYDGCKNTNIVCMDCIVEKHVCIV